MKEVNRLAYNSHFFLFLILITVSHFSISFISFVLVYLLSVNISNIYLLFFQFLISWVLHCMHKIISLFYFESLGTSVVSVPDVLSKLFCPSSFTVLLCFVNFSYCYLCSFFCSRWRYCNISFLDLTIFLVFISCKFCFSCNILKGFFHWFILTICQRNDIYSEGFCAIFLTAFLLC